jgi:hypothetical protein
LLRDCLGHARRDQHGLLAALIRPVFHADSQAQARDRLSEAVTHLDGRMGKVATMLEHAEPDILAFYVFPPSHWRKRRGSSDAATSRPSRCLSSSRGRDDHTDTEITREGRGSSRPGPST